MGDSDVQSAAGISYTQYYMAYELQYLHDKRKPCEWPAALRRIAKKFNLDASVVKDA